MPLRAGSCLLEIAHPEQIILVHSVHYSLLYRERIDSGCPLAAQEEFVPRIESGRLLFESVHLYLVEFNQAEGPHVQTLATSVGYHSHFWDPCSLLLGAFLV